MNGAFPKLYAIVDRATLDMRGVGVGEFARELRNAGVRLVQYRDKVNRPQEILRAAGEIDAAFAGAEVQRIMNDRADLAVLAGWEGVHVGQGDLPVDAARRVMRPGKIIGVSTHSEEQLRAAIASAPDYVALGPVFATASKANPDPVVGLNFVRRARTMTDLPIVAIGGISLANARSVIDAGGDAVAVIGGMFMEGREIAEVLEDFLVALR